MRSLNATTLLLSSEGKWIEPQQSSPFFFLTKSCSHAAALSDTSNIVYSLFFSMSGCQGKDLVLFCFLYSRIDMFFFFLKKAPQNKQHCVIFRYDSSGESAADKALGRTSSYTRREARLASVNKQEQDSTSTTKDYKKVSDQCIIIKTK